MLFPANGPSANRVIPELQSISVGTFIPDGPPETECGLHVVELRPERAMVLRSITHLPKSWRDRATLDWSWAFALRPLEDGRRTRYHFRSRWLGVKKCAESAHVLGRADRVVAQARCVH